MLSLSILNLFLKNIFNRLNPTLKIEKIKTIINALINDIISVVCHLYYSKKYDSNTNLQLFPQVMYIY